MKKLSALRRFFALTIACASLLMLLSACGNSQTPSGVKLDPKNPTTVTVWHYYNGGTKNAFDQLVKEFNDSVGAQQGVIVSAFCMGNVSELEKAVISSAKKEVGSQDMPNIFASYADTAYAAEQLGILADLSRYFSAEEQAEYVPSYIEEGKIGLNGELRIFPVAKSTEIFMLSEADWTPFAQDCGLTYADLATKEGVARVAALYYEWTDAKTPDVPEDGLAFFGRDAMANLMIIGSMQLGTEIFEVKNGAAQINIDREAMRRIWDSYYVPYINGYYLSSGRYRSDDAKVGEIIAYVGSTSSAAYFPGEVTIDGSTHTTSALVLPVPAFEGGENILVQQGAGMVVTKSTAEQEYASAMFLKWFTDTKQNIRFSAISGYMPVKTQANSTETFNAVLSENQLSIDSVTENTLNVSFDTLEHSTLYTNKAFSGGADARAVLEHSLQDKAVADRASVKELMAQGISREDAVAQFNTEDNFELWLSAMTQALNDAAK